MIPTPTLSLDYVRTWRPGLAGLDDDDLLQWYHAAIPTLRPEAVIVEVGTWRGRSLLFAAELLAALGRPLSRIYGVDPYRYPPVDGDLECCTVSYRDALAGLVANGAEQELHHVHLLRAESVHAVRLLRPASVDLVMIDADHSYEGVAHDIDCWHSRLRPRGILAGHDYGPDWPGVVEAADEYCGDRLRRHGSVWWKEV